MGAARFTQLLEMLPEEMTVVGLDEKTALIVDPQTGKCQVVGASGVTLLHTGHGHRRGQNRSSESMSAHQLPDYLRTILEQRDSHYHYYDNGASFPLSEIGPFRAYHPEASLPAEVWQKALVALQPVPAESPANPPEEVLKLVQQREQARQQKAWQASDALRNQIDELGWQVVDTPGGPQLNRKA
jgi:hypothetical protein